MLKMVYMVVVLWLIIFSMHSWVTSEVVPSMKSKLIKRGMLHARG